MKKVKKMPAISASTLNFLKEVKENNNREWFSENKSNYLGAKENVITFLTELIEKTGEFDEEISKLSADKSLFRIYRDIRFSLDKSPYKTNFGAGLGMGKGNKIAGYYIHIEPGKSFAAAGVHRPDSKILKIIRQEFSAYPEEFLAVLNNADFKKNFAGFDESEKLVKVPAAFDKENKMAEYLKLKQFIVIKNLTDKEILSENAVEKISEIFRAAKPLNDFLETPFK